MDLPKGLVTTFPRIPSHLEDPNVIDALDIARLWKVYHTNPAVHNNDSGHRLENFFWRVWGNERLRCSLQGETLATLFVNIAESQARKFSSSSIVKLKPLGNMSSEVTISDVSAQLPPTPPTEENESDNVTRNSNGRSNSDPIPNANANIRDPLPPILKKPKSLNGNGSPQKKARLLLTGIGGQHVTRKPSNPLTPISPPPFAAVSKEGQNSTTATTTTTDNNTATDTNTTTNTTAATTRGQYQSQKRPHFVASKTNKRRPVLGRRRTSQTAVPRYEAKGDYFAQGNASTHTNTSTCMNTTTNTNTNTRTTVGFSRDHDDSDLKEQKPASPAGEEEVKYCEKTTQKESSDSESPVPPDQKNQQSKQNERTESPNEPQPSNGKYASPDDPNLKNLPPNLVSNLKLLLTQQKPTTNAAATKPNNPKTRPKQIPYPSTTTNATTNRLNNHEREHLRRLKSTTYIHQLQLQLQQHQQPAKLVDDHFRVRFVEELQREEKFLNAVNSLPEEERSAVLEGHSGRSKAPRLPRTSWVEVTGGVDAGVKREGSVETIGTIQQERSEADTNDHDDGWSFTGEDGGGWTADDAQDNYPDTQVDAVPFKFEGMSYTSSWRAACRLQVPGQLTVMLRAEQYGYRGDTGVVDRSY